MDLEAINLKSVSLGQDQDPGRAVHPPEAPERIRFLPFQLLVHHARLCVCAPLASSFPVCNHFPPISNKDTYNWTWTHLDNQDILMSRSLTITSAKKVFSNKVKLTSSRNQDVNILWEGRHFLVYYIFPLALKDSCLFHMQNTFTPFQHSQKSQPIRVSIQDRNLI